MIVASKGLPQGYQKRGFQGEAKKAPRKSLQAPLRAQDSSRKTPRESPNWTPKSIKNRCKITLRLDLANQALILLQGAPGIKD